MSGPILKPRSSAAIPTVAPLPEPEPETRKPRERTGFKRRGEDDDDRPRRRTYDDDDESDPTPTAPGGNGLLFVIIGVGILLLGGIGVGVYYLTKEETPAVVESPDPNGIIPGPGPVGPGPRPNPGPIPNKPGMPEGWDTVTGDGFTTNAPQANLSEGPFAALNLTGRVWTSKELATGIGCSAAFLDRVPGERVGKPLDLARAAYGLPATEGRLAGNRTINGRSCTEVQFDGVNAGTVWIHITEDRVFLFRFSHNGGLSPEGRNKRDHFQANIKITHPQGNVEPDPVDPGPGPIGPKPKPKPPETPFEPVPTIAEDGFAVEMPGGAKVKGERHTYGIDRKYTVGGKKFEVKDGPYTFQVYYHDLANETDYDADKCFKPLLPHAHQPAGIDEKLAGLPATRWTLKNFFNGLCPALTVRSGFRVFSLMVTKDGIHNAVDPDLEARGKKFLDSFKVTFDPAKAPTELVDPTWTTMARTVGFKATAPRGTTVNDYQRGFRDTQVTGKQYVAEDDQIRCVVTLVEFGPKVDPDAAFLEIHGRDKIIAGPNKITHKGLNGEEFSQGGFNEETRARVRTFRLGTNALAVLKVETRNGPEREVMLKARAFFNSFEIGGGAIAGGGGGPVAVGNGEFASPGKLQPFWSATVLTDKKEIITVSVRNPADVKPGGVLRRYSYPEFKLKGTYNLPLPASHVVADETGGKLVCAVITQWPGATLDTREGDNWYADLQIFDLKKVTDGTLAEGDELKPVGNKVSFGQTAITGLTVDPSGRFAYAAGAFTPPIVKGQPARSPSGRVYKIDLTKGEILGNPILHPEPLNGLRMHQFGKTLVSSEMVLGQAPAGKPFNLLTIDAVGWKKSKLVPIPAPAKDLTFTGDGILALVPTEAAASILGYVDGSAETTNVTPKDVPLEGFAFLRVTPSGKYAIASAGKKQNGIVLLTVKGEGDKATFQKVTSGATVSGAAVGGQFYLTPDSKYALFNSGAIVDLEKTTAPPKGKE